MEPLLRIDAVCKQFLLGGKALDAVCDVSLDLMQGETLGVVGESGCGKTTLARMIMGVHPPTRGQIFYRGEPVSLHSHRERRDWARRAQMVFQDPYASLNPRMTVDAIISENLVIQRRLNRAGCRARTLELLELVGLPSSYADRFPHECSGGQRQRVGIARALAADPELLVCDEPISALDISIQSQIMTLLRRLKEELGLTYLFIAHDLAMVRYLSERIAVMLLGRVCELAFTQALCDAPLHPYSQRLFASSLSARPGNPPDWSLFDKEEPPLSRDGGCPFAGRCPRAQAPCHTELPPLLERLPGRFVACHFPLELPL